MNLIKALRTLALVLVGAIALVLVIAILVYPPEYVYRATVWLDSDAFDWQKFPSHPLTAAPTAHYFESALDPRVA
jgi:hypothetical protein